MTDPPAPFGNLGSPAPDPDTVREAVATIATRDPLFNLDTFLAEAQQAFWLVGQAHAQCKPELCAGVLGPALGERERAAIERQCRNGKGSSPGEADADSGRLVSIASDASHDTIVVHFTSTWQTVGGRGKGDRRVQNWCFQRPATAMTGMAASAGERCRNCGGLLSQSAGGTCRYCGTQTGSGAGWRIIRIDEVQAQEAASAVAAMQSIVATMASAGRQSQGSTPVSGASRRPARGCLLKPILLTLVVLAGLGFYAVESSGSVHHAAARVFPSIRHARLHGPLDLTGAIVAPQLVGTQVPPLLQSGGTCAQAAQRTAWNFKAKLPDGSSFHLVLGLPPGTGAPGVYKRPQLTVTANAKNASRLESWTAIATSVAVLTVQPGGGGDVKFTNLPSDQTGTAPLSGHVAWTCDLA